MHLVVAYDVMEDRRRNRLARFLMGYLDRVQKSVFEGAIEDRRYQAMKTGIEEIVDRETDTVRIYHLCVRCISGVEIIGTGEYVEEPDEDFVF